jgi:hypothetical protein
MKASGKTVNGRPDDIATCTTAITSPHRRGLYITNYLADLTDREAAAAWGQGRPYAHDGKRMIASSPSVSAEPVLARRLFQPRACGPGLFALDRLIGANTMRSVLIVSLLMTLCTSANAATLHHNGARHHVIIPRGVASSFAAVPGSAFAPPPPAVQYDDTPSYNDPLEIWRLSGVTLQN